MIIPRAASSSTTSALQFMKRTFILHSAVINQFYLHQRPLCISNVVLQKSKKTTVLLNTNRRGKLMPVGRKKMESQKQAVQIFEGINLRQLAIAMDMDLNDLMDCLLEIASENIAEKYLDQLDAPMERELVLNIVSANKMRHVVIPPPKAVHVDESELDILPQPPPEPAECHKRAPVITIMGHVDHGKTTLLDALRHSNIVAQEFGGITQHIGAFSVKLPHVGNLPVTFLDTPGHAAFKAMRERGARATDIVVLVVAADDSVMEQTVESIRYAKEAGVPIIVAINKCDKPGANPERVLHDLLQHDVVVEQFGGDTMAVELSALHGHGIDKLQEAILLQAELMQLESTSNGLVEATIIESSNIQGLGNVCTLIVNRGILRCGTVLVAGTSWGRVRTMRNEFNAKVDEAGPSTPVRISGWRANLPAPGEIALEASNELDAQRVINLRSRKIQEKMYIKQMQMIEQKRVEARNVYKVRRMELFNKGILAQIGKPPKAYTALSEEEKEMTKRPKLSLILKCDVDGTKEAIHDVLNTYDADDQVRLDVVESIVGPLNQQDIELATETGAQILVFNAPVSSKMREMAVQKNVQLEEFHVIYKLVERLKELLSEQIEPVVERRLLGEGTIIHAYRITDGQKKRQPIAGIRVDWGTMETKGIWRFVRTVLKASAKDTKKAEKTLPTTADVVEPSEPTTTQILYEGSITSMQHEKQTINKATIDMQIGVAIEDKSVRWKEDDRVEVFEDIELPQKTRWNPPGF